MLLEARGELDFAKRKAIYDEMQVMVSTEAGTAIPVYISNVDALAPKRAAACSRTRSAADGLRLRRVRLARGLIA